jgi:biopolymer transport protein ExbD
MSLTSPLGLMRHVRRPNLRLEVVPWLNVILLGWLMSLLSSSYIYAPGLAVGLVGLPNTSPRLALPESASQLSLLHIDAALTILPPFYYLDDGRHYQSDLPKALRDIVANDNHRPDLVLLLKYNRNVSAQTVSDVSTMAREAGFATVQQAMIPAAEQDAASPPAPPAPTANNP